MTTYVFRAVDTAGVPSRGEVTAESKQSVADQLKSRGLIVLDIDDKSKSHEFNLDFLQRIKPSELTVMTRQLATMVSSGLTILRTLYVLEDQTENKRLRATIVQIRKDVEAGLSFSDALRRHPKVFNPLYIAMVESGETGGLLESSLIRVADQLEADDSLRRKVRSAMVYPTVVMVFALSVTLALIAFIVPVFADVFDQFDAELPAITQATMTVSDALTGYWYVWLFGAAGIVVAFQKWRKSSWGRPQWDRLRLRIPFKIGDIVQKIALARWSRTLAALTSAGVPVLESIRITGRTAGNSVIDEAMERVLESVKRGGTISEPLKQSPVFPAMVTHMITVGEETGAMETMLTKVADFYEDEVDSAVKSLTSILEPVMIVVVGAIVGFIVVSMYMPMFKVYDAIQ